VIHRQAGQPTGQVDWDAVGVKQLGDGDEGPPCCTLQQSWPFVQNLLPQQNDPGGGFIWLAHGGALHAKPPGA